MKTPLTPCRFDGSTCIFEPAVQGVASVTAGCCGHSARISRSEMLSPLNRLDIIPSLPGGFETGIAPPKFGKIFIRTFLPRLFKGKSFKSCSHGIKFAELGLTDRAHPQSLVGCLNEQAIFSQLQHGFAQRSHGLRQGGLPVPFRSASHPARGHLK